MLSEDSQTDLSKTSAKLPQFEAGFLTVAQAAERLGTWPSTITRWCESGKLPAIPKSYGSKTSYLIAPATVDLILTQQEATKSKKGVPSKATHKPHFDFVKPWSAAMTKGLLTGKPYSERTIADYEHYIDLYFDRHSKISPEGLKVELGRIPSDSVSRRQHCYKAVRCFGKYLIAEGALEPDFIERIKPLSPKYHKPPKRHTITVENLEAILKACDSALERTLVTMLANTGLRASELCALKVADVDANEGTLVVRCGKGGKTRKLGLNSTVIECLLQYRKDCPSNGWLFRDTKGKQMHRHGLYQRLERIGMRAGIKVSPHSLRRAFVTHNANLGKPLQMLQMACGHSDIKTTMSYCRTSERDLIDAMKDW